MKFADVEHEIRTGDILLFRGTAWYARFIQWWTRSRFSHAGVAFWLKPNHDPDDDRLCIIEALTSGVRLFPMDMYLHQCEADGTAVDWYAITDPKIERDRVACFAFRQWGHRYVSALQMLLSFGWLTRWVRHLLRRDADRNLDPERFFCSELCAAALAHAGYVPPLDEAVPAVDADPGTLALFPCLQRRGSLTL